jgi:predicted DNA-binding transcriptional regulator YafY
MSGETVSLGVVEVDYTNHRGERAWRRIVPGFRWWGSTEHHSPACWLLDAWDVDKGAMRSFAVADVHGSRATNELAAVPAHLAAFWEQQLARWLP